VARRQLASELAMLQALESLERDQQGLATTNGLLALVNGLKTRPGRKALYVNSGFTDRIKGLRPDESRALLDMLFDKVALSVEAQVRVRWAPNTVTFWDNRCVQHHASWDYFPETRSGWRVTTRGERPYLDLG
jgi:taurine dioxygenase